MDFLTDLAQKFGTEFLEFADKTGSTLDQIIPEPIADFAREIFGSFLTVISPVWNPLWSAFNELLEAMF